MKMDQLKHTPGPWVVRAGELWGANGQRVVVNRFHGSVRLGNSNEEERANGALCDAAADMYEALKALDLHPAAIVVATADTLTIRVPVAVIQKMATAVAKAEALTPDGGE